MEQLCKEQFPQWTREQVCEWMNQIYKKALLYIGESDVRYIQAFPNQKGKFLEPWKLKRDETPGDELKEISREFWDMDPECDVYQSALDRLIHLDLGYGLLALREEDVAMRIHRVVQQILSVKNLSDALPNHQEACTRLLGWIQENLQKAEKYFPGFTREEEQMKLLTPKVAVRIQKKARDCQLILEELGAGTMEEAMEKLTEFRREMERIEQERTEEQEGEENFSGALWDDMAWDEELEAEYGNVSHSRKGEILRQIGEAGERYALEQVKNYFQELGYERIRETAEEIWMERSKEARVKIDYPDGGRCHQAGWDICVSLVEKEKEKNYYLEVKTHTKKSVLKDTLSLSGEQMKAAARNRERYMVLNVVYDYKRKAGEELHTFADPVDQIGKGVFVGQQKTYRFFVDNRGLVPQTRTAEDDILLL